jgi:hypothetical protein
MEAVRQGEGEQQRRSDTEQTDPDRSQNEF